MVLEGHCRFGRSSGLNDRYLVDGSLSLDTNRAVNQGLLGQFIEFHLHRHCDSLQLRIETFDRALLMISTSAPRKEEKIRPRGTFFYSPTLVLLSAILIVVGLDRRRCNSKA